MVEAFSPNVRDEVLNKAKKLVEGDEDVSFEYEIQGTNDTIELDFSESDTDDADVVAIVAESVVGKEVDYKDRNVKLGDIIL